MRIPKTGKWFFQALAISVIALYGCDEIYDAKEPKPKDEGFNYSSFKQGWTENEAMDFYNTSQGSQLIPYYWFMALEQFDNDKPFRDNENIKRLGYIPQKKSQGINPDGLPIGFVKDIGSESFLSSISKSRYVSSTQGLHSEYKEWLGLTCAACHTSEIRYNDQTFRIEGGPSLSDFQSFFEEMSKAVDQTTQDDEKLTRFAKSVLAENGYNEIEKQRIKTELSSYKTWLDSYSGMNYSGLESRYGHGRLDAFGAILNRVTASFTGIKDNATPANAPVSYPFLWNTSQLHWVQWNGSANNHIGRNVGEVSGVFADTIVDTDMASERFDSSANIINLDRLEQLMGKLDSPNWEEHLPAIDQEKALQGKALYVKNCSSCHSLRDKDGQFPMTTPNAVGKQFIEIEMTLLKEIKLFIPTIDLTGVKTIDTDPLMALNFVNPEFNVDPGILREYLDQEDKGKDKVQRAKVLRVVVQNVINKQLAAFQPPLDDQQKLELTGGHLGDEKPVVIAYKARPLNGIWATAPFLHNGSVSNLYEILLPETSRKSYFYVGSRELDTKDVGFKSTQEENRFLYRTLNDQGQAIPGNGNYGHSGENYTSTLDDAGQWQNYTDEQRYQLIEFMKTL